MKTRAVRNREALKEIKRRYMTGEIDRQHAKETAKPVLANINLDIVKSTEKLNKKYQLKHTPPILTFIEQ